MRAYIEDVFLRTCICYIYYTYAANVPIDYHLGVGSIDFEENRTICATDYSRRNHAVIAALSISLVSFFFFFLFALCGLLSFLFSSLLFHSVYIAFRLWDACRDTMTINKSKA